MRDLYAAYGLPVDKVDVSKENGRGNAGWAWRFFSISSDVEPEHGWRFEDLSELGDVLQCAMALTDPSWNLPERYFH